MAKKFKTRKDYSLERLTGTKDSGRWKQTFSRDWT